MGFLKSIFRSSAYPLIRPFEQVKSSLSNINNDITSLRQARIERAQRIEQERADHLEKVNQEVWEGYRPTEEELKDPALISNPNQRFEVLYTLNGWTEKSLSEQHKAVRLTKWVAAYLSLILMILSIASLFYYPVWVIMFTGPMLMTGSAIGFASSFKHAIYQTQIESRRLISYKELMLRKDLIKYLFQRK